MTIPNHPKSPDFLKAQRGTSPEDCAWVAVSQLENSADLSGFPLSTRWSIRRRFRKEGHELASIDVSGRGLGRVACVECGNCGQDIVIRGPAESQAAGMNATGDNRLCVIWERVPDYPLEDQSAVQ